MKIEIKIKRAVLLTTLIAATVMVATPAGARSRDHGHHNGFQDFGRVIDVDPIERWHEVPVEHRVCSSRGHRDHGYERGHHRRHRHERRRRRHHDQHHRDSVLPTVVGAAIGGVIGHQVVTGDARLFATAAGAVIGAVVGQELVRDRHHGHHRSERVHCRTVIEYEREREVIGYNVTYRYRGRRFTTRTDHHPGRRLRIDVDVHPRHRD